MQTMDTQAKTDKSNERITGLALFLGMAIWFLHLNLLNALTSVSCEWGWFSSTIAGMPGLVFVQAVITVLALLLMLFMIYLPWRNLRRLRAEKPTEKSDVLENTEKDRRPLLAFIAMMLNCFFLLFVIATFVPMFALNTCGQG